MYRNKEIVTVIPVYNEEEQIGKVLSTLPEFIDNVVVVDDMSKDRSVDIIEHIATSNSKIKLIKRNANGGTGMARITGLKYVLNEKLGDIVVMIDGDGQMDPNEISSLLDPIIDGRVDATKGNRFFSGEAWRRIPHIRYMGNAFLSLLTKIASGYWHIADSQTGFFAIKRETFERIDIEHIYNFYGFPNDLVVHLNVANCRLMDVPVKPIYGIGERSTMKIHKVLLFLPFLLVKRFFWRLFQKYVIRDFHPLVFFYILSGALFLADIPFTIRFFVLWSADGRIPPITAISIIFLTIMAFQSMFFAMLFDMEYNRELK